MRVLFDIETDGLLRAEDGKPEATKVHCLVIKDMDTGEVWSCFPNAQEATIDSGIRLLEQADEVCGHNIICYDIPVLQKLRNLRLKPTCKIIDTLVCSRLIWTDIKDKDYANQAKTQMPAQLLSQGSHSLEAWGYRVGLRKGDFSNKQTDWSVWTPDMQAYCELDVQVTERLRGLIDSKKYSQEALDLEHQFQSIIHLQEQTGFGFDSPYAQQVYSKMAAKRDELKRQLQEVFPAKIETMKTPEYWTGFHADASFWPGMRDAWYATKGEAQKAKAKNITPGPMKTKAHPFNPDSGQQVADRLKEKYGWLPQAFTVTGLPKIDDETLADLPFPEAKLLCEYAILGKRIGALAEGEQGWLKHVEGGRVYGSMITNGAVTGRCTHRLVVNVPREPQPWGLEMRSCFVASPGWWLVGCDAAGLEARCQAHFLFPFDGGAMTEAVLSGDKSKGTDVHSINRNALGLEPTSANREVAKTWYYAFIYGSGNFKSGSIVGVSEQDIETLNKLDGRSREAAKRWLTKENLAASPKNIATHIKGGLLKKMFLERSPTLAKLIDAVKKSARTNGYLKGLDGRALNIRSDYAALNTLLQSAGALVMKKAACILYEELLCGYRWEYGKDFQLVANVHDEIQAECPTKEKAEKFGKLAAWAIEQAGVHFKFKCPLAGEYKVGKNWHETH